MLTTQLKNGNHTDSWSLQCMPPQTYPCLVLIQKGTTVLNLVFTIPIDFQYIHSMCLYSQTISFCFLFLKSCYKVVWFFWCSLQRIRYPLARENIFLNIRKSEKYFNRILKKISVTQFTSLNSKIINYKNKNFLFFSGCLFSVLWMASRSAALPFLSPFSSVLFFLLNHCLSSANVYNFF